MTPGRGRHWLSRVPFCQVLKKGRASRETVQK
jgi:hypothetical protein